MRIWLVIYLATAFAVYWFHIIPPFILIGFPHLYVAGHHATTGLLQNLGLAENVTCRQLNKRTALINPISRFIYLNMNYHF
tara:strand:- start:7166 stop:7408 length:243 start_codon:yes stop_codon:yes gene_type:complete